jgi:hypothetical protein
MNRYVESLCKSSNLSQNETKEATNKVRFNRRPRTSIYDWFLDYSTTLYELKTLYNVEWDIGISWVGKNFEKKWSLYILWYYSWTDWGKPGRPSELSVARPRFNPRRPASWMQCSRCINLLSPRDRAIDLLKIRDNNIHATCTDSCYPVRNPAGTCQTEGTLSLFSSVNS